MKRLILFSLILNVAFSFGQVGIGTTTPLSTLDIQGNLSLKVLDYNGGPGGSASPISDGIYINLRPSAGNLEFILPNPTTVPGRIYIMRNVTDNFTAIIYTLGGNATPGAGSEFYPGDSRVSLGPLQPVNMLPDTSGSGGIISKTLIFVSDGSNWTYGHLGR